MFCSRLFVTLHQRILKAHEKSHYYEIIFSKEGTFTVSHWQQNENYSSSWVTEVGKFIVNGDIVFLSDDSGDDPLELNFDKEKKTLYLRAYSPNTNYGSMSIYVYMSKF